MKCLHDVEVWLPINPLWSKLRHSDPFWNAIISNKGRSSNCGQVLAQFSNFALSNSKVTRSMCTKFLHNVEALLQLFMCTFTRQYCISVQNTRVKSEGGQFRRRQSPKVIGYYRKFATSLVPWATAKIISN